MHLIHKHSIRINSRQEQLGTQINDEIGSVLETEFYPRLEKLLSSYDHQSTLWQIEQLPVTINDVDAKNWRTEIVEKSIRQVELYLDEHKPIQIINGEPGPQAGPVRKISREEYIQNLVQALWRDE